MFDGSLCRAGQHRQEGDKGDDRKRVEKESEGKDDGAQPRAHGVVAHRAERDGCDGGGEDPSSHLNSALFKNTAALGACDVFVLTYACLAPLVLAGFADKCILAKGAHAGERDSLVFVAYDAFRHGLIGVGVKKSIPGGT